VSVIEVWKVADRAAAYDTEAPFEPPRSRAHAMPRPGPEADDAATPERPSKTQRKREASDLQRLGLELAELSDQRLARVDMPENLRDALTEYRRTRSHEGRRRQLQYVGKLMRDADPEPLRQAVAEAALGSARDTLALHQAERWRDELISDDDALARWLQAHAQCDAQRLRTLIRAARADAALPPGQRQPRAYRELFQFIRPFLSTP
jgi:ribosome-associated protein